MITKKSVWNINFPRLCFNDLVCSKISMLIMVFTKLDCGVLSKGHVTENKR